jgi:bifunctional non-homologous end joining protein LigD
MAASPSQPAPMLATAGLLPPDPDRYAFEYKWDGMRAVASCSGGRVRLVSRNGNDVTARFPELRGLASALGGRDAVLDGEIVALDGRGRPDFGLMQLRMGLLDQAEAERRAQAGPVRYFVFDVLELDGRSLARRPFRERRAVLESLGISGPNWTVPPSHVGEGAAMLEVSRAMGLEGIVAKRLDSPYRPGERSPEWVKVRNRMRQEFVVCGWSEGQGSRSGMFRALLLGVRLKPGGPLAYVGRVGSGFKGAEVERLTRRLKAIPRFDPPLASTAGIDLATVHWVEPVLVAEVEFSGLARGGVLRQASFKGLRSDKRPEEVVWEQAEPPQAAAGKEVTPWQGLSGADPSVLAS